MARKFKTMDGNTAAAHVAYAFTEVASIYPITPSTGMAESVDAWSAQGLKNIFGQEVSVVELQSEAGAAGTMHGALTAGALTTSFTASQGLLLMVPNMYKMAGELLPGVLHVSARTLATHALSIFGDHSDVMATRQTGFGLLCTSSVQEVMDLAAVAHLTAIKARVPFIHFFDGFRTSHEVQKIEVIEYDEFAKMVDMDAVKKFKEEALRPEKPNQRGTAQNPDIFFQNREAVNKYYTALPSVVEEYLGKINEITGKDYKLFNYYGSQDAERIIIAMGSVCETIEETIDYLNAKGEKVGLVKVRLYRPFSVKHLLGVIPSTVKKISVLDRTKEPGAIGEPLFLDIINSYYEKENRPLIVGGRYGLSSKDTTPGQIVAVYDNLKADKPRNGFTVGINDDVTHLSLDYDNTIDASPIGTYSCKFWGLGSDGTVGANKNSVKIIGDNSNKYSQAYFSYDSKKSGGITISHLRFSEKIIKSTYLVSKADFVACHNPSYVTKYDIAEDLKVGGTFLLNTNWDIKELGQRLPASMKKHIANNNIKLYTIDGFKIARELGLGNKLNIIMQAAFFKLTNIIPLELSVEKMRQAIISTYGRKGEEIVKMNTDAIQMGIEMVRFVEVPADWKDSSDAKVEHKEAPSYVSDFMKPIIRQKGDTLPVSAFTDKVKGNSPQGTTQYEKRLIAVEVPAWKKENCIQCNQCSYVCPHAVIRPYIMDKDETAKKPENFETIKAMGKGFEDYQFSMQISVEDCTGCGNCAEICPSKVKSLVMTEIENELHQIDNWKYAQTLKEKELPIDKETVKGSQFIKPLFEFSGACAGCGETPYIKLITQLYGDRMLIANATGCSSIYGGSAPANPYTTNSQGCGPAWANSLFEDNAEFGYGMSVANRQTRSKLKDLLVELTNVDVSAEVKEKAQNWITNMENGKQSKIATLELLKLLNEGKFSGKAQELVSEIKERKDYLVKKSQWIFGGDGWAYDIGFGGLDHVIASGDDVKILVVDTEVYSNTGGQSSKATPIGATALFAAKGKRIKKKDLGAIAMTYGNVYVAQVAMGADKNQLMKVLVEAENHPGPAVIIAYSPCIAHGIKSGMGTTQHEEKKAVESGYWHLYRYNPALEEQGKNPFILDSKEPTGSISEYMKNENRFAVLMRSNPKDAEILMEIAEKDARKRYEKLKKLATN